MIGNAVWSHYTQARRLPADLAVDELRTCLFFELRRRTHTGAPPEPEYIEALLGATRQRVAAGDVAPAPSAWVAAVLETVEDEQEPPTRGPSWLAVFGGLAILLLAALLVL